MSTIFEIDNVSKSYLQKKKTVHALRNISLTIQQGDCYGLVGLSGAGKSTLIRCLSRLVIPTSGRILFKGQDLAQMNSQELRFFRRNIGMVFQHFNLLGSRTVADNIGYPLEIAQTSKEEKNRRVDELLDLVGLTAKKESYPSQLSGGESQRVGIARALANRPTVLLCDEITSALDPKTTKETLFLLNNIGKEWGITLILITHAMNVIANSCHKVAVMEEGQVIENGLVSEIFANPQHPTTQAFLNGI